jgi:hypothetical protein
MKMTDLRGIFLSVKAFLTTHSSAMLGKNNDIRRKKTRKDKFLAVNTRSYFSTLMTLEISATFSRFFIAEMAFSRDFSLVMWVIKIMETIPLSSVGGFCNTVVIETPNFPKIPEI